MEALGNRRQKALFSCLLLFTQAGRGTPVFCWLPDEEYPGYTCRPHKMALPAEKGPHRLTLIDDSGHERHIAFEVNNE